MNRLWSLGALSIVAQAALSCDTALWIPKIGETVGEATDALGIGLEVFGEYNERVSNFDAIYTTQTFTVPYKSPLPSGSWLTEQNTCFLQLSTTGEEAHSSIEYLETRKTISSSATAGPSYDHTDQISSIPTKTRGNLPARLTSTALGEVTTTDQRSTTEKTTPTGNSLFAKPTKTISPECGLDESLPLECHRVNDGSFVTDEKVLKSTAEDFCADRAEKFIITGDGPQVLPYKDHEGNEYLFQIYRVPDCSPKVGPKVRNAEECMCIFWHTWKDCDSNGGTGGRATDVDACLEYYYSPKRGTEVPAEIIISERGLWIETTPVTT